jgi:hypothetical protein
MSSYWSARPRALRPSWLVALAALVFAALTPLLQGAVPPQPLPTQRVNLKVLVVGPSGNQADYLAWQAVLQREGVPFDARTSGQVTPGLLSSGNTANYQAVIVTTGTPFAQLTTLNQYEATFGIRQLTITGDTFNPAVARGLNAVAVPPGFADQSGQTGQLTATGLQAFPYLKGPVPMDPFSFGFSAIPDPNTFTSLVSGPGGGSYLGIYTDPIDLRQEMVFTVSSNQFQIENQLLRHGMVTWVTRGVYLGTQRNYFAVDIDDMFLPDGKWDPVTKSTPDVAQVRMSPSDVTAAVAFQTANNIQFTFMFNGVGYQDEQDGNNGVAATGDALIANRASFRWVNHTFSGAPVDLVPLGNVNTPGTALGEIALNKAFAAQHGIAINPAEIVNDTHSGIGTYVGVLPTGDCNGLPCPANPNVLNAFTNQGILWVGDDNSARPNQRQVGSALTVPRYPSNVYYNVASRADQLDEYNWIYTTKQNTVPEVGNCTPSNVTTCRPTPATWADYLASEVGIMFRHVMGNDPRPHYTHQSNLILDANGLGILYKHPGAAGEPGVLDELLARYKTYFNVPLVQPTLAESGALLRKADVFAGLWPSGAVGGYLQDGKVHVINNTGGPVEVPLTGTTAGDLYGGAQRSGWVTVNPGDNVFTPADPLNVTPPSASGAAAIGATITAAPGQWLSSAVPGLLYSGRYQWQRCNVNLCVNIAGVTDANYKTGTIDRGFSIRVVEMAGNWVSSVSQAASNAILMPGPPPPPGTLPPTGPAPGNVAAGLTRLVLTNVTVSPRRFKGQKVVKVRGKRRVIGGSTIRWRLNAPAKVQIVVQKRKLVKVGRRRVARWVHFGAIQRDAKAGAGRYIFTGRIVNNKLIGPAQYRFVISAFRNSPKLKTPAKAITFTFLKG